MSEQTFGTFSEDEFRDILKDLNEVRRSFEYEGDMIRELSIDLNSTIRRMEEEYKKKFYEEPGNEEGEEESFDMNPDEVIEISKDTYLDCSKEGLEGMRDLLREKDDHLSEHAAAAIDFAIKKIYG